MGLRMAKVFCPTLLAIGAIVLGSALNGQSPAARWDTLRTALSAGTRVEVVLPKGLRLMGEVVEVANSGLTIVHRAQPKSLDRAEIVRIYRAVPRSGHRSLWLGAAIGAVAGGVGMAVIYKKGDLQRGAIPTMAALGAGVGGLLGHVTRKRADWVEVYSKYAGAESAGGRSTVGP